MQRLDSELRKENVGFIQKHARGGDSSSSDEMPTLRLNKIA
jgi:hypothetical protein